MKNKHYEEALAALEPELVTMARWARAKGQRVLVLLEGRDTAGKSGVISAIRGPLNPRQCRVVALGKPSEAEAGQWYFQRYVQHLPTAGEIVLFDRSWYNRAGVEKVMGFATPEQVDAFLAAVPVFEKLLVDDGIRLFKYWLGTDQAEQEERFAERVADPLKRWKLSPIDVQARTLYDEYTQAREAMFAATHTAHAPWTMVNFNDQKHGRLTLIRNLLDRLPDCALPEEPIDWPPLGHEPLPERYELIQPLPPYPVPGD
ncbi:polyphosphate kinase 2 [Alteraurantiacibacter buctensis]|uniref:ADP/GDP-polyphosphate phosphotransferase n=1 Tax=Alteraurantiacibacter buctensis TaxID=1503981 RepID=A0A844YUS7_9SPHN|nr:polyphosphate kinase 2 [Alteraurantiacibacter buctensis]MXO70776.1 polyphosphate kinase 2 [Alteraurantiacibacter buctensis]